MTAAVQIPDALASLYDDGVIEQVLRPLMSGKEAQVFLVLAGGAVRVAKIYKDAQHRSFKHRAEYTEGRKTRNSRDARALAKRSKHGRSQDESAWKSTEVDMIHRLHAGGVRVPTPYAFIDGVLVMECVVGPDGEPAPRLGDRAFSPDEARAIYGRVMREIVRMLAAGVVHGDLSEFNVLLAGDEPVIIDFPQAVDTAKNPNARRLLLRDVDNVFRFLSRHAPGEPRLPYGEEMWALHESNALAPDTRLTGRFQAARQRSSPESVLGLIRDADRDERSRRDALGMRGGPRPGPPAAPGPRPSSGATHPARPGSPQGPRAETPRYAPQPQRRDAPQHPRRDAPQHARRDAPQPPRHDAPPYGRPSSPQHPRPDAPQPQRSDAVSSPRAEGQQPDRAGDHRRRPRRRR
jgi:RIO kinase 1